MGNNFVKRPIVDEKQEQRDLVYHIFFYFKFYFISFKILTVIFLIKISSIYLWQHQFLSWLYKRIVLKRILYSKKKQ